MFDVAIWDSISVALLAQTSDTVPAAAFDWVKLVARVFHSLGGILLVGGLLFMRLALTPSLGEQPAGESSEVQAGLRRRWSKWVGVAVGALIISGFYNLFEVVRLFDVPKYYHPIFGTKFLLALFVFFIASVLAGRSAAAARFQARSTLWLNLAILASLLIVILAVILGLAPKTPKVAELVTASLQVC